MKQLSIKVLRSLVLGEKISRCNLSLELFSLGAVFVWKICPTGNYVGGNHTKSNFLRRQFPGDIVRGHYLWGKCFGAIIQGQSSGGQFSLEAIILWGNNPRGNHPGPNCLGGNYPGGNFLWGQFSGHHQRHI